MFVVIMVCQEITGSILSDIENVLDRKLEFALTREFPGPTADP